jgi:hypothetical protein
MIGSVKGELIIWLLNVQQNNMKVKNLFNIVMEKELKDWSGRGFTRKQGSVDSTA